jgi:hypothetical protein
MTMPTHVRLAAVKNSFLSASTVNALTVTLVVISAQGHVQHATGN